MMGLSPNDLNEMSWWEYQALLWNWNDIHGGNEEDVADAPDSDFVDRFFDRLSSAGLVNESVH